MQYWFLNSLMSWQIKEGISERDLIDQKLILQSMEAKIKKITNKVVPISKENHIWIWFYHKKSERKKMHKNLIIFQFLSHILKQTCSQSAKQKIFYL